MEFLKQIGPILAILTPIIFVAVYGFSAVKKGKNDIVRQDNADLRASNTELRTEKAGHLATITSQADTIKNLREVATQTPEVKALLKATAEQQILINKQHTDVIAKLSDLATEISKMTAEFSKVATAMGKNTIAQNTSNHLRENNNGK